MPHFPKPFCRRRATGMFWYVSIFKDGKRVQISLGSEQEKAFEEYHRLMQQHRQSDEHQAVSSETFGGVAGAYVADLAGRRKPNTVDAASYRLRYAVEFLDPATPIKDVRRFHLAAIEKGMREATKQIGPKDDQKTVKRFGPTTINSVLSAVQAVVAWAVETDRIPSNPVAKYKKPAQRSRTRVMTDDEFQQLLRAAHANAPLRRILIAARYTGCRPCELRQLTWGMVDFRSGIWIIPIESHKTGTQQKTPKPRIVPLSPKIVRLCGWLSARRTSELVFLNEDGNAWTKDSLGLAFRRARERAGIADHGGEKIVLYTSRHSFGTKVAKDHGLLTAAALMGHTNVRTTQKYVHLSQDDLVEMRKKVSE